MIPYKRLVAGFLLAFSLTACNPVVEFNLDLTSDNSPLLFVNDNFTETAYPIVLVHGLYGFDDIFGLQYFYQIPLVLRNGGSEVFIAEVSGTFTPEVRGEQLIPQLEDYRAISGKMKFNLFGHSLGAPTIRYVASVRPDLVASITTVAGVNHGSEAADSEVVDIPPVRAIIAVLGNSLGHFIDFVSQNTFEQNLVATIESMNQAGAAAFNAAHPDGLPTTPCATDGAPVANGIRYYSFSGNQAETNPFDPLDGLHGTVSKLIAGDDDDGFVQRCSTHLGVVLRDDYPMNHLDVMNWFLGLRSESAPYAPSIYRMQANRLKLDGV